MMKLPLSKYIKLTDLYCYDPCGGMLERPRDNRELNQHLLESAKKRVSEMWGQRAIHVQPMEMDGPPPKVAVLAWLSGEAIDPDYHGSDLVVIFFTNNLHEVIADLTIVVGGLDWNKVAQDYEV